jgi:preprotein translocase subunit SecA
MTSTVGKIIKEAFDRQKHSLGTFYDQVQKMVLLQAIDHHWKGHLAMIDHLKEGINLRGYAQKDPLIEYKKEAFTAFEQLNYAIKSEVLEKFMKVQIVSQDQVERMQEQQAPDLGELNYQGADESAAGGGNVPAPAGGSPSQATRANNEGQAPQRMRMRAGPPSNEPERTLNREDRRRMEKSKRR